MSGLTGLKYLEAENFKELHRTAQNFTELHRTSQNVTERHRTSQNFTELHRTYRQSGLANQFTQGAVFVTGPDQATSEMPAVFEHVVHVHGRSGVPHNDDFTQRHHHGSDVAGGKEGGEGGGRGGGERE
jgi:hypothetical protein